MLIVILGAGVVGTQIASQLIEEGKDVVIIERNKERAKYVSARLDCIVINEEGTNIASLKNADMDKADIFISVTNSDEVNMIACALVASEFGNVKTKIARVRNLDYSETKIIDKPFFGIDYVVNTEVETARKIAHTVALGAASDVVLFENTDLQMRNIQVAEDSLFKDKQIKDLHNYIKEPFLIAGIVSNNSFVIPSGDTVINKDDILYLLSSPYDFAKMFAHSDRRKSKRISSIILAGGGEIGFLVCRYLANTGRKITLIEIDYELCKVLAEKFPDVLVINADISAEETFTEENLGSYDLIIAATDNQELNILTSVYAKHIGVKHSISLVTNSNYIPIAAQLDIDSTISTKLSTVDAIMKYIRKGDIKSVNSIFDGKAEVIEFSIDDDNIMGHKLLRDIKLPPDTLVLSVVRKKRSYLPDGNFMILPGDVVIIISGKESIAQLEEFFLD
ncbi:MAG: Trk system potassium transporter TrkA [Spirochaetia bacterium]|jgi:trk system potassium uptake protein TrkA|nr:Trk system potassium transporter TrkA [Spirochaetia bacterium]